MVYKNSASELCIKRAPSHAKQPDTIFIIDWKMGSLDRGKADTKTQIAIRTNLLKMGVFLFFLLTSRAQACDRIVTFGVRAITRRNLHMVK
jgi:hypothetical protein